MVLPGNEIPEPNKEIHLNFEPFMIVRSFICHSE